MRSGSAHQFDLMIKGECIHVGIYPMYGSIYKVVFAHCIETLGEMRRVEGPRRFICKDSKSGKEFSGTTRQQAATAMIYDCYPTGEVKDA